MALLGAAKQLQLNDDAKWFGRSFVDTIWPQHSLIDGKVLPKSRHAEYRIALWQKLEFLDQPCCDACGYPFEFSVGDGAICGACAAHCPPYTKGRSAIRYSNDSKKLVLDFKHGGHTDGLEFFAQQMHRVGANLLKEADCMIPIPLHPRRLRKRRFNQSALLSRKLSKMTGTPYLTSLLVRTRNTPPQGTQSFLKRKRNVSGAFTVKQIHEPKLKNAQIVLIDDVYTTGATLGACARVLKRAGARRVDFLTLMRVVRAKESGR